MTVTLDKDDSGSDGPDEPTEPPPADQRPSLPRRMLNGYLYGNQFVVTVLSFLCAIVVGAILIAVADDPTRASLGQLFTDPGTPLGHAWGAISAGYSALFRGSVLNFESLQAHSGDPIFLPISDTLVNAAPLILGGLAVSVAFRAGLFNIGVQGQLIMGAIGAGYAGFAWHLPVALHLIVAILMGIAGGVLWGFIVGWLKARTGAHEVITTIMLNYVAYNLLSYLLGLDGFQAPHSNEATSSPILSSARLPNLFEDLHSGLIIAIIAVVACWWLFSRSTFGFAIRAVGANPAAARTAGINTARVTIIAMSISGLLAGLVGVSQVLGTRHVLTLDVDGNGLGFDAITVSLLGRGTPLGTALAGLLFGALRAGGVVMGAQTNTPPDIVSVIEPVLVLFIAAPNLIRGIFHLRAARGGGGGAAALAKGWNG